MLPVCSYSSLLDVLSLLDRSLPLSSNKIPIIAPFNPKLPMRALRYERVMFRFLSGWCMNCIERLNHLKHEKLHIFRQYRGWCLVYPGVSWCAEKCQRAHQCHSMLSNRIGTCHVSRPETVYRSSFGKTSSNDFWARSAMCIHVHPCANMCQLFNDLGQTSMQPNGYRRARVPQWCRVLQPLSDPHDRSRRNVTRSF